MATTHPEFLASTGAGAQPVQAPLRMIQGCVLTLLAFKLAFAFLVPPNGDEAYYFLWGQHPQWSYRDHAPMVGWGESVSAALFGWTIFGLRFPTLVTSAAAIGLFWLWARKLAPDNAQITFWSLLGVYFASPMFMYTSTNVYPDHFLVVFLLGATYFLSQFLGAWREGAANAYRDLYLAAGCMGLAGLSKYNAVFFGLALIGVLASDRRWRGLFRAPQLYLAGLIALALVSPVILWNAAHQFASVALHSEERFDTPGRVGGFTFYGFLQEGGAILFFGPFLLPALWRFLREAPGEGATSPGTDGAIHALGKWCFYISTGFMLALACWGPASANVKAYWTDVSFIPFLVLAPRFCADARLFRAHLALGTLVFGVTAVLYIFDPLLTFGRPLEGTRFGQSEIAEAARRAMQENGADFIAAPHYVQASQLAFGAGSDADIVSVSGEKDQFSYWRDMSALRGKTAILVLRGAVPPEAAQGPFREITPLRSVTTQRFGGTINVVTLFLARDYVGQP